MPRVYVMNNPQPNAFATGRNPQNAAVCASTGLLEMLTPEEVAGVMAHELAHVKNYDTLTMAVAATIGGAISMLAQYLQFGALFGGNRDNNNGIGWIGALVAMIVAPLAAMLVQMAISRSREYQADRCGALICGNPLWLASALGKIEHYAHGIRNEPAEAAPATAHLFIINPLTGRGHGQPVLDPPQHREPHRRAGEAGGRAGRHRSAEHVTQRGERSAQQPKLIIQLKNSYEADDGDAARSELTKKARAKEQLTAAWRARCCAATCFTPWAW